MKTLTSAPVMTRARSVERQAADPSERAASVSGEGGARPSLAVLRPPADAPIQMVSFNRFSGIRRLWNWSYNDRETRMLARERQAREYVDGLRPYAAHVPAVAQLHQRLTAHENATIGEGGYDGHMAELDRLHDEAERLSYHVSTQGQMVANVEGDAIHAEHGRIHAEINQHGLSSARLDALDALQTRHRDLMTMVHASDLDLPLPDRATLAPHAHAQVQADWRALTRTNDVVRFAGNGPTPGQAADLRAMHARLLAGGNGRELLHQLVASSVVPQDDAPPTRRTLLIRGTAPDTADLATRRARPGNRAMLAREGGRLQTIQDDIFGRHDAVRRRNGARQEEDALGQEFNRRVERPRAALLARYPAHMVEAPAPAAASQDGTSMTLREGIRDSEALSEGQAVHGVRPDIVSPAFITYGHELVHVMRRRQAVLPPLGALPGWGNQEEQDTIAGAGAGQVGPVHALRALNENALRDDYNLRRRDHHTSRSREAAGF